MTQEEKELLLKDLCARLPYGIFVKENREYLDDIPTIYTDDSPTIYTFDYHPCIDNCKPYLRPMSSMTEEEKKELGNIRPYLIDKNDNVTGVQCNSFIQISECQDWLNEHHFDYRGLIEKGLALEAPENLYY